MIDKKETVLATNYYRTEKIRIFATVAQKESAVLTTTINYYENEPRNMS